ncbi:MAG TPA: hypothetical protein VHZ49_00985 [Methylomirabilota bacterium]|jgi:hypothetical protein|nr:hypothetical protein [Methylomirabilota bacterium]
MKNLVLSAALAAAAMMIVTPAFAQGTKAQKDCAGQPSASARGGAKAPEKIEGQVTSVDKKNGTLTVQAPDGTTHQFKGSKDTVNDYKAGDKIELSLRAEPNC